MIQFWLIILFFSEIILYFIIIDIVFSWLFLFWLKWKPAFIWAIVEPIYELINKLVPTKFWMFRFDALIAIIILYFIMWIVKINIPWLNEELIRLTNYF